MTFRLIVSEAPDLTTVRSLGQLHGDAVALLGEACRRARRPLVLDLSDLLGISEAGVTLLRGLQRDGVHLLGAPPYVRLLLGHPDDPTPRRPRGRDPAPRRVDAGQTRLGCARDRPPEGLG